MKVSLLYEKNSKDSIYRESLSTLITLLEEKNTEIEGIGLEKGSIKKCRGCFGCWVKTPGECVIGDYGNEVAKKVINSDKCIILTSIKFGSYSSVIKQAVDRFIPLISPFFRFIDGEVHHRIRYSRYPKLIPVGVTSGNNKKQEELFIKVAQRNRINFFSVPEETVVINGKDNQKTIGQKLEIALN